MYKIICFTDQKREHPVKRIDDGMDDFNAMSKRMEAVRKKREMEGRFWENEIREMNRWYQM